MRWIYAREARRLAAFEAVASRCAHTTLVVNSRERATLCRMAPDANVHVMPNGVASAALQPRRAPGGEPRVVFCGVMNYRPNEQAAIWLARAVWPLVLQRRPDARLLLLGSNPTAAVRRLAVRDSTVHVTGRVDDVRPHLWDAAVAAAPLAIARGVQNKVMEAIAAGLPAVITPIVSEGLPNEVKIACRIASTAESFAAALVDLLALTPVERRRLAASADLARLDWPRQLEPLVSILEDAAGVRSVLPVQAAAR
jgi:glycosyltransferase involved in cell wall biosynthesis